MIRDLYLSAIVNNHHSLVLLIDYLVNERKIVTFESDEKALDYYFQDKFKNKMNEYLNEYEKVKQMVKISNEVNVYEIRIFDTYFFVAAHTKEQAEAYFKAEYGEIHEIKIMFPELQVEGENGELHTLQELLTKEKSFPSILGCWNLWGKRNESRTS